jgi:spore coat protein YsxE
MSEQNLLQQIEPILKHYSIQPHFVESFGTVQRVYGDKGVFALKKIDREQGTDFIRNIQSLYQKGYHRIVPVYPTNDGRYAVLYQNSLYYLMPWLPNELKENRYERHQQLFRELARLHTLSVQEVRIDKEERDRHYENMTHEWDKQTEFLEGYLEQCENRTYMSPFELLYCLYYHEISQALVFSKNKLKEWYEKTKEENKARVVLSHGKVSTEHFIYDDRGYGFFSNFEDSKLGSPLLDLLPFLSRTLTTYPKRSEDCLDWIYTYLKFFPLKEEEMLLLLSYFSQPGHVVRVVENYYKSQRKHERKMVKQLQQQYWLLKNTEYVVMRIIEIEEQKKQQAEADAQEQTEAQS